MIRKSEKIDKQEELHKLRRYSQNGFLRVDKLVVAVFGWICAGVLTNLLDKYEYWLSKEEKCMDGWFYHTMENQSKELGLSEFQVRGQKKILVEYGILNTKIKGLPPKEFFKINMEVLENILKNDLRNYPQIFKGTILKFFEECPSKNLRNIKDTKYKKNEIKENLLPPQVVETTTPKPTDHCIGIKASQFEDFWEIYPRKVDKGKAKMAWTRITSKPKKTRPTWKEIKLAILKQRKSERWKDIKYVPHPTTWLNNQRWLDDPKEMKKNNFFRAGTNRLGCSNSEKYGNVINVDFDSQKGLI